MIEMRDTTSGAGIRLVRLRCRRTGRWLSPQQHLACPYCLGEEDALSHGRYAGFCDYDARKDPVSFGFPPDGAHVQG